MTGEKDRAFGSWLGRKLKTLEISGREFAQTLQRPGHSLLSLIINGKRRVTKRSQVRILVGLYQLGAFAHPGEPLKGWLLLGVPPTEALARVKQIPLATERANRPPTAPLGKTRREFIDWMEHWLSKAVDPQAQGVRLPGYYVQRPAMLQRLKQLLFTPHSTAPIVLWGTGGSGKSVLAQALALDAETREQFWNGVLWGHLGPHGDPRAVLRRWATWLKIEVPAHEPLSALSQRVQSALAGEGRRYLLIIDDVWETAALQPLLVAGRDSATLITLREQTLAQKAHLDDHLVAVESWAPAPARQLIRKRLGTQQGTPAQLQELAELVDYLPLALVLGAAVVKERGWAEVLAYLREQRRALDALELAQAARRAESVRRTLALSYQYRSPQGKLLLLLLGGLAPGETFHVDYLACSRRLQEILSPDRSFPIKPSPDTLLRTPAAVQQWCRSAFRELVQACLIEELEPRRRYRVHRVVALFALDKLQASPNADLILRTYVEHSADFLARWYRKPQAGPAPPALAAHWPHIAQAWQAAPHVWRNVPAQAATPASAQAEQWAALFGYLGGAYLHRHRAWTALLAWIRRAHTLLTEVRQQAPTLALRGPEWATIWVWGLEAALHTKDEAAFNTFLYDLQPPPKRIPQRRLWTLRGRIWQGRWALAHGSFATAETLYRQTARAVRQILSAAEPQAESAVLTRAELYELQGAFAAAQRRWQQAALANTFAMEQYLSLQPGDRVAYVGRIEQALERSARLSSVVGSWRAATENGIQWLTYRHQTHLPLLPAALEVILWALRGAAWQSAQGLLETLREKPEHDQGAGDLWALQALLTGLQEQPEAARQAWHHAQHWYQAHPSVKSHLPWLRLAQIQEALERGERPVLPEAETPESCVASRSSAVWEALLSS